MQTFIRKDIRNNWKAESAVMINDTLQLSIRTLKQSDGKLNTCASVGRVKDGMVSTMLYGDFFKSIVRAKHGRITSKVVERQHADAIANVDSIINEAKEFYNVA